MNSDLRVIAEWLGIPLWETSMHVHGLPGTEQLGRTILQKENANGSKTEYCPHKNWEQLMECIEKIKMYKSVLEVVMIAGKDKSECIIWESGNQSRLITVHTGGNTLSEAVFKATLEFIKLRKLNGN